MSCLYEVVYIHIKQYMYIMGRFGGPDPSINYQGGPMAPLGPPSPDSYSTN